MNENTTDVETPDETPAPKKRNIRRAVNLGLGVLSGVAIAGGFAMLKSQSDECCDFDEESSEEDTTEE